MCNVKSSELYSDLVEDKALPVRRGIDESNTETVLELPKSYHWQVQIDMGSPTEIVHL
jgi:hypothetical protein